MKFILIIGLPCSGKTYLANTIPNSTLIDDIDIFSNSKAIELIEQSIKYNKDIVITSCHLCFSNVRSRSIKALSKYNLDIQYIYFENNLNKCLNNYEYRRALGDTRKVKEFIINLSINYIIPYNIKPLSIWQSPCNLKAFY